MKAWGCARIVLVTVPGGQSIHQTGKICLGGYTQGINQIVEGDKTEYIWTVMKTHYLLIILQNICPRRGRRLSGRVGEAVKRIEGREGEG